MELFLLLCATGFFSKYAWVVPLKVKKGIMITNAFQNKLDESIRKPNKIQEDKGSEFYNRSMKSWLQDNDIDKYSIYSEEKSVITERFIKTLKNKIYKYMTSISKNVYVDNLADVVNKYNKTYLRAMKMRSADVKSNAYIGFNVEKNDADPKFEIDDHVRI